MSFNNYSQYLGRQKCCDLRGIGPQGATGPRGLQGAIGPVGYTGATGPMGPTGAPGATGPPASQNLESVLSVGNNAGATGINMNSQNVYSANSFNCDNGSGITSALNTTSLTITDPISFAPNTRTAVLDSQIFKLDYPANNCSILLDNAISTAIPSMTLDDGNTNNYVYITAQGLSSNDANGLTDISPNNISISNTTNNQGINISVNSLNIQDTNNSNSIFLDNASSATVPTININDGPGSLLCQITGSNLTFDNGSTSVVLYRSGNDFIMSGSDNCRVLCDSSSKDFYAGDPFGNSNGVTVGILQSSRNINLDSNSGTTTLGDINSLGNSTKLIIDDSTSKIQLNANSPIYVSNSGIQMSSQYNTTSQVFTTDSKYIQTFNGASLTATLPSINSSNVGIQFLITNVNATALVISSTGGQSIYLSGSSATSQNILARNSYLLTSIQNGAATYGWTMN